MTVSTQVSRIIAQGNNVTVTFTYTFPIVGASATDQTNARLVYTDTTGVSTTMADNLWSITGVVTQPTDWAAGTFRLSTSTPITTGALLTLERTSPYTQETTLGNQGAYSPEVVEAALDMLALQTEQLNTWRLQSVRAPIEDDALVDLPPATWRADSFMIFDSDGQPATASVNSGLPSSIYIGTNSTTATLTQELLITGGQVTSVATVAGVTTATLRSFQGALLQKTSTQAITNTTVTTVNWDSALYDTTAFYNHATHPTRLTIPSGVTYVRLTGYVEWASATGCLVCIIKNGTALGSNPPGLPVQDVLPAGGSQNLGCTTGVLVVTAGDYFEFQVYQVSGGSLNVLALGGTFFSIEVVG